MLVASLLCVVAPPAQAEDKAAARAAYAEGRRDYDLNEFTPALEAFKRAYLAYEDPVFLFNIAQCHRQLGNRQEAIKFYRSYLRNSPEADNREEVNATFARLQAELAQEKQLAASATTAAKSVEPSQSLEASTPMVATAVPPPRRTPMYKRWWLWTVVGVVAAGAATGLALGLTSQRTESSLMPVMVSR
ncbi:MAG: hypothetical protein NVSMB57_14880 [Actinomycetota bacterium]